MRLIHLMSLLLVACLCGCIESVDIAPVEFRRPGEAYTETMVMVTETVAARDIPAGTVIEGGSLFDSGRYLEESEAPADIVPHHWLLSGKKLARDVKKGEVIKR